jgi:DNA-directed RNA polymerase specialized sigma24 family protein
MNNYNPEETKAIARIALRKALRALPKAQHDAYLYVEILGFTTREAGTILCCDHKTVCNNLQRACYSILKLFSS